MNRTLFIVLLSVGTVFAVVGLLAFFVVIDIQSKYADQTIGGEAQQLASGVGTVAFVSLSISGAMFYVVYKMKRKV